LGYLTLLNLSKLYTPIFHFMHRLYKVQTRQCMLNSLRTLSHAHMPFCQGNRLASTFSHTARNSACPEMTGSTVRPISGTSRLPWAVSVDSHRYGRKCHLTTSTRFSTQNTRKPSNKHQQRQEATDDIKRRTVANLFRTISKEDNTERIEKIRKAARLCCELRDKRLTLQLLDQMEAINCPPDDETLRFMLMVSI
jgi:hypothetical protein